MTSVFGDMPAVGAKKPSGSPTRSPGKQDHFRIGAKESRAARHGRDDDGGVDRRVTGLASRMSATAAPILLRSGNLQQLTSDHSLVAEQVRRGILTAAEAEHSEMQSVLLRALGAHAEIEVDAEEHPLFGRDVLLLCSDGLTRMVTEPEIAGTLQAEPDPARPPQGLWSWPTSKAARTTLRYRGATRQRIQGMVFVAAPGRANKIRSQRFRRRKIRWRSSA